MLDKVFPHTVAWISYSQEVELELRKRILGWSAKFESCWHTNDNCSKHCGWNSVGPAERERKGLDIYMLAWEGAGKGQSFSNLSTIGESMSWGVSRGHVECCTWNRGSCFAFLADGTQAVLWYLQCQTAPNVDSLTPTWIVSIMSWPLFCFSSRIQLDFIVSSA